jgi:hypothetical protein
MADAIAPLPTATVVAPTTTVVTSQLAAVLKSGWRTSEFYFTLAATLLSGAYSVGLIGSGVAGQVAGLAAFTLTQAGYAVSRGLAKAGS